METLTIPDDAVVSFTMAEIPREVPPQIRAILGDDATDITTSIAFNGRTFHLLHGEDSPNYPAFWQAVVLDVDSGEVIRLVGRNYAPRPISERPEIGGGWDEFFDRQAK